MKSPHSDRGQAVIETLVVSTVIAATLGFGFHLLYVAFAKAWITRAVREAAVCLTTSEHTSSCRTRLQSTLDLGLPFGNVQIDDFHRRLAESQASIRFECRFPLGPTTDFKVSNSAPRF